MLNPIEEAAVRAAEYGGTPPMVWAAGPSAVVEFGAGSNPLDGMTITGWANV